MEWADVMKIRVMTELAVTAVQQAMQSGESFDDVVQAGMAMDVGDCPKEQIHESNVMLFALLAQERNRAEGHY